MMREERTPETASTCPACNSPVNAGDRFCEKCGEEISPPQTPSQAPVCRSCGTPLLPNARFCENCGDPVKKAEVSAAPSTPASALPDSKEPILPRGLVVTEEPLTVVSPGILEVSGPVNAPSITAPDGVEPVMVERFGRQSVQEAESWEEPEDEFAEKSGEALDGEVVEGLSDEPEENKGHVTEEPGPAAPLPESRAGPVDELLLGLEPEEPTRSGPEKRPVGAVTTILEKTAAPMPTAPRKGGSSKKTLITIGLIAAILVIAIAIVALLPVLTGPGVSGTNAPAAQATPVATATSVVTTVPTPPPTPVETATSAPALAVLAETPVVTETPDQVDILPPQYTLHFEVFKDVVTGDVTVTATGPSRNVVKDFEVTVFHPDGTTDSDHLIPSQGMTEITVTGTRSAERVVVMVLFYSGEQYTLVDRIVSFSRRT
jgi:hypothetical protein